MSPTDVFQLSFTVQLAIASGYLAYVISYAGIRQHHTTADSVLRSAAFGLPAMAVMAKGYQHWFLTPLVAVALSLALGVSWRMIGIRAWQAALRKGKISWADDVPTAWISATASDTTATVSQVAVELLDGRLLLCEDTRVYADAHSGPCLFGLNGDVAIYVDAEQRQDGTWDEKKDVRHFRTGDLLTFIPAAQVKRIDIRYLTEKAEKAALAAEAMELAAKDEQSPECRSASDPSD